MTTYTIRSAALVAVAAVTFSPAVRAQSAAGTSIRRNTSTADTMNSVVTPTQPAPPLPTTPQEVGGTGSVGAEHGPAGQMRGPSGPAPGETTGPIGPADVARLVRAQDARLRGCYETARATHPDLAGRVEVRFTIGRTGEVTQSTATGLPQAPEVATCIAQQIRVTRFPPPESGTLPFVYPMTFTPPAPPRGRGRATRPTHPTAPAHPARPSPPSRH